MFKNRFNYSLLFPALLFFAGGLMTGMIVYKSVFTAWILLGMVTGLVMLRASIRVWIYTTVLMATLSRSLSGMEFVPSVINFFHYPFVIGTAIVAVIKGRKNVPISRILMEGMGLFLFISVVSWLINGGGILKPFLNWLVFSEPFLLIYSVTKLPKEKENINSLNNLVLFVAFLQFPFVLWQVITIGWGDPARGTFLGMGAGAHVAGSVALIGALLLSAKNLSKNDVQKNNFWLIGALILFLIPILTDAKQVIIAFIPAITIVLLSYLQFRLNQTIVIFFVFFAIIFEAFNFYTPLRTVTNWTIIREGSYGKIESIIFIAKKMTEKPVDWIIGLGPGNSVSRVALMGLEAFVKHDSPVFLLGLKPSPITQEIYLRTTTNWLFSSSSVWTGISSWFALFGDLGILGIGIFGWVCLKIWKNLKRKNFGAAIAGRGVLLMAGILGLIYSWFEEPGFTVMAAIVIGLGLLGDAKEDPEGGENSTGTQLL